MRKNVNSIVSANAAATAANVELTNAAATQSTTEATEATQFENTDNGVINTKVKGIRVYNRGDRVMYRVGIDTLVDAIVKEDDEYVDGEVDYVDFVPRVLIAQAIDLVDGLDLLYTKKKEQGLRDGSNGFGAAELNVVLRGAKIQIERHRHEANEEYTTSDGVVETYEYAGYSTSIKKIVVTERIQKKLDEMIDKMFDI